AFTAVGCAGLLWRLGRPLDLGVGGALVRAGGIAVLFSLVNSWVGVGRGWCRSARPALVVDLAFSTGVSTFLVAVLDWLWPSSQHIPLGMVIVAGLLAFLGFAAVRYRERVVTGFASQWLRRRKNGRNKMKERVLIVGA